MINLTLSFYQLNWNKKKSNNSEMNQLKYMIIISISKE